MVYRDRFQVGGTLDSNHSSYVVRQADLQLSSYLEKGEFCFILNCRQMGKSSLTIRTADRLQNKNFSCAFSDLSILGTSNITPEQWYKSFAYQVLESLDLDDLDLDEWWKKYNSLTAVDCLSKLFKEIVLTEISSNIVIFIDEIDSIIKLPFKDDFFALIRGFYNKRTIDPNYKRLTFCLLGVATPPDLIADKIRTPFNIGRPIDLKGFTVEEAKNSLLWGLSESVKQAENVLSEVIYWTGGQPFLTQKLCQLVTEHAADYHINVKEIVHKYIIEDWESQDNPQHFRTIRDRLLFDKNNTLKLLELYQQISQQNQIIADDSIAQSQLRISGLVVKRERYLQVYNPIYKKIFNNHWVLEQLNNLRPYSIQFNTWLAAERSEDYLLNKKDLDRAYQWAGKKNLTRDDYEYLSASREQQNKQEKEQIVKEKNRLIRRRIIGASIVISLISVVTVALGIYGYNKKSEAIISSLNNESNLALEGFNQGEQLAGLIKAIKVNYELKKQIKNTQSIVEYITTEPIEDLNNIINQIQERNKVKISKNSITSLAYTSDGKIIISGDENGKVKLWNSITNKITTWKSLPNTEKITDIVISPDEQIYIANQAKNTGILVFALNGNFKNSFKTNSNISSLAINTQNNYLISGDNSGNITLWSQDGQIIKTWSAHKEQINKIAVSSTNNQIATASNDTTVKLWTTEGDLIAILTGKEIGHNDSVNDVAFSPDGQTVATASKDTTIKLWNKDGSLQKNLLGHNGAVNSIAFSSDGQTIISVSDDKTIKLWDMGFLKETIIGHQTEVNQVVFESNNRTFISAGNDGTLKNWHNPDFASDRFQTGVFLENQQILLVNPQNTQIQSLEGQTIKTISNPQNKFINAIAFNPDNNTLFAGTEDGLLAQLNLKKSDSWQTWQHHSYRGAIIAIDIHQTSNNLITLGVEKSGDNASYIIKEWNQNGQLINTFNYKKEQEITAIKYISQGNKIAIATKQGNIELWDSNGNFHRAIATSRADNITSIAFSPDGKLIATSDGEGNIELRAIDLESDSINDKLLATFTHKDVSKILDINFTADGKAIRAVNQYGILYYWNLDIDILLQQGCNWLKNYSTTEANIHCNSSLSKKSQRKIGVSNPSRRGKKSGVE